MSCTGTKEGSKQEQLLNFTQNFSAAFYQGIALQPFKTWRSAFEMLTQEIKKINPKKKVIIFLDELPWLASSKSGLLQQLDYFWNTEWSNLPNLKLIVCGSAASWMLEKLINAKGGLHNRITQSILLKPFNLKKTKEFLVYKKIKVNEVQTLTLYMVMGGIPYYLELLDRSKSIAQNITELCFTKEGALFTEFPRLFKSLFENAELNLKIVEAISLKRYGVAGVDLAEKVGKKIGGRFNDRLAELEAAGFIEGFLPYGKQKRGYHYKVIDPYTTFYLKWIQPMVNKKSVPRGADYWSQLFISPAWNAWAGYTFEAICSYHIEAILTALKLNKLVCFISDWRVHSARNSEEQGAQIDLVIERSDGAITLCEIKYAKESFSIDKAYAKQLIQKGECFERYLGTKKQIFWAIISNTEFKPNIWSEDLINQTVGLKDLFQEA